MNGKRIGLLASLLLIPVVATAGPGEVSGTGELLRVGDRGAVIRLDDSGEEIDLRAAMIRGADEEWTYDPEVLEALAGLHTGDRVRVRWRATGRRTYLTAIRRLDGEAEPSEADEERADREEIEEEEEETGETEEERERHLQRANRAYKRQREEIAGMILEHQIQAEQLGRSMAQLNQAWEECLEIAEAGADAEGIRREIRRRQTDFRRLANGRREVVAAIEELFLELLLPPEPEEEDEETGEASEEEREEAERMERRIRDANRGYERGKRKVAERIAEANTGNGQIVQSIQQLDAEWRKCIEALEEGGERAAERQLRESASAFRRIAYGRNDVVDEIEELFEGLLFEEED